MPKSTEARTITVGQLIDQLANFPRDAELFFGSYDSLTFYRLKQRGENLIQIEFCEQVYRDDSGKLVAHDLEQ